MKFHNWVARSLIYSNIFAVQILAYYGTAMPHGLNSPICIRIWNVKLLLHYNFGYNILESACITLSRHLSLFFCINI